MSDKSAPSGPSPLREEFAAKAKGQDNATEPPRERTVNASARLEISNAGDLEQALEAHDQKWARELYRLSHQSTPYPDFDLGSRAHRNIVAEYEERRTNWEYERSGIEGRFEAKRVEIRTTRPTLSGEFNGYSPRQDVNTQTANAPQQQEASNTNVPQENSSRSDALAETGNKDRFPAHAETMDRGKSR